MNRQSAISRYRSAERDSPPQQAKPAGFKPYPSSYDHGRAMREVGLSLEAMLEIVWREGGDPHGFAHGFTGIKPCVHFVGFRGEEYWSAVRIWGKPDYIWLEATFHILGECAPADLVIFGPKAFNVPKKWRSVVKTASPLPARPSD